MMVGGRVVGGDAVVAVFVIEGSAYAVTEYGYVYRMEGEGDAIGWRKCLGGVPGTAANPTV